MSKHDPVSTPRSSNRTCGSPASGSRTRQHARACDALHGARHFPEFIGLPQSPCPCRCPRRLEPGPLPSTGITRLRRYYEPLRRPAAPGLSLAGRRLAATLAAALRGFPCCSGLPSVRAIATTPAERPGACFAHFPSPVSLPPVRAESASASRFSRPAQRSLTLWPAPSRDGLTTLYTRGFQPLGCLPRLLQLLPAGAKVAGGDSHPLKDRAFARRHPNAPLHRRETSKRSAAG